MKIIIDPGHGGYDPGAFYGGVCEKHINLSIALKLKILLPNSALTREKDVFISLQDRIKLVTKEDLFLSIHCNACEESKPNGFEVWHYLNFNSEKLANNLLESMKNELTMFGNRGKRDTMALYVLKKAPCVASLIECGFLSNENDRKLLTDNAIQNLIAKSIHNGVMSYLNASN